MASEHGLMTCPSCGNQISINARKCPVCGEPELEMRRKETLAAYKREQKETLATLAAYKWEQRKAYFERSERAQNALLDTLGSLLKNRYFWVGILIIFLIAGVYSWKFEKNYRSEFARNGYSADILIQKLNLILVAFNYPEMKLIKDNKDLSLREYKAGNLFELRFTRSNDSSPSFTLTAQTKVAEFEPDRDLPRIQNVFISVILLYFDNKIDETGKKERTAGLAKLGFGPLALKESGTEESWGSNGSGRRFELKHDVGSINLIVN